MHAQDNQPVAASIAPGSRALTLMVVLLIAFGVCWVLEQADQLSSARRQLPAGCLQTLADMPPEDARAHGVPLRECARRKLPADRKASLIGVWSYGIEDARVDGYIALVRQALPDGISNDRLMHVSIDGNRAVLDDFSAAGQGCAGGIDEVSVKDNDFTYVANLTPERLVTFAGSRDIARIYRPGDLEASPLYCAAEVSFSNRRPVLVTLKDKPVTATGQPVPEDKITGTPPAQACFDKLVRDYTTSGHATLAFPEEYIVFVSDYIANCTDGRPVEPPAAATAAKPKAKPKAKRNAPAKIPHFTQRYY